MLTEWLSRKWQRERPSDPDAVPPLALNVQAMFRTAQGQQVLQHLLDHIYCLPFESVNPTEQAVFLGRRSVVQELLELIDQADHPDKYHITDAGSPAGSARR